MFGSKKPVTTTSLTNKTADILGVFTNTIEGLENVADAARSEALDRKETAQKLLNEATEFNNIADQNLRIAEKMQAVFDLEF